MKKLATKEKTRLLNSYGSWAIITGASSGIGKELAYRVAEAGFNIIISARSEDSLKNMQQELTEKNKVVVEILATDLSTYKGTQQLILQAKNKSIGLLIISAGFGTSGSFLKTSIEAEMNMLDLNCKSLLQLTHYFAQQFVHQNKGGIVLLSSIVAFQGVPFAANYAATKAYVQTLAEALSRELKPHNVDVLAAAPGPVRSGFEKRANMQMGMFLTPNQVGVPILRALGRKTTVLPGPLTKILVYSLRTVPRWAKVRIMQLVMGGMTKHQQQ